MFWSGLGKGGDKIAENWAKANGGETLEMYLTKNRIEQPSFLENRGFWNAQSKQFAEGAVGDVTVLHGPSVNVKSVWNTIEKPALMNNPNVTSVTFVNPLE